MQSFNRKKKHYNNQYNCSSYRELIDFPTAKKNKEIIFFLCDS